MKPYISTTSTAEYSRGNIGKQNVQEMAEGELKTQCFTVSLLQTFYNLLVIKTNCFLLVLNLHFPNISTYNPYFLSLPLRLRVLVSSSIAHDHFNRTSATSTISALHSLNTPLLSSSTASSRSVLISTTPTSLHKLQHISAPHTITRTSSFHHITRPSATPLDPGQIQKIIQNPTVYI